MTKWDSPSRKGADGVSHPTTGSAPLPNPESIGPDGPHASIIEGMSIAELVASAKQAAIAGNQSLSDEEFGAKLAQLVTSKGLVEERVEAEGMKEMLNPGRFAEFYVAYAKLVQLHAGDMVINTPLTDMGKTFGRDALDALLRLQPQGFERWDSLIQGWASVQPQAATDWFNDLDETHPRYDSALSGLIWGLAEKDGPMTAQILAELSASDQEKAVYGFASSFVHNHGLASFDTWLASTDASFAPKALQAATDFARYQPPQDFVPWFAAHANTLGIRRELTNGFAQWFKTNPSDSMDWLLTLPEQNSSRASILKTLPGVVDANDRERFLLSQPGHPGVDLLHAAVVD